MFLQFYTNKLMCMHDKKACPTELSKQGLCSTNNSLGQDSNSVSQQPVRDSGSLYGSMIGQQISASTGCSRILSTTDKVQHGHNSADQSLLAKKNHQPTALLAERFSQPKQSLARPESSKPIEQVKLFSWPAPGLVMQNYQPAS